MRQIHIAMLALLLAAGCAATDPEPPTGNPLVDAVAEKTERQVQRQEDHVGYRINREVDESVDQALDDIFD